MKSLVGKFAFYDEGETYQTGEIVAAASPDAYLIKFDSYGHGDAPLPMEVVSVEEMAAMVNHGPNCNCHQKAWRFFETRAEMEAWVKWLDTPPPEPKKVVRLVKH
jgi:hypothetical protein